MFNSKILFVALLASGSLFAGSAENLIAENGCLGCHAIASRKAAPAFAGIGKRNKMLYSSNAKAIIVKSIKNGSSGKYRRFSSSAMPAFSNFSDKELNILADYILAQSSKAKGHGGGRGRNFKGKF